ncbi:MAG: sigma 54-interacting transcriptional regulator, partial [Myxococcota bacterium]
AQRARTGHFEAANGGTIFLDEITSLPLHLQASLLRVLQEREVTRVGELSTRPIDTRVVAATNRDLRREVEQGRFREDLYFRLAVIPIRLPPLRARPEDILPLARHFLAAWNDTMGRNLQGWNLAVERWMLHHHWPGNVRELENTLERAVVLARGDTITLDDLLLDSHTPPISDDDGSSPSSGDGLSLHDFLDRVAAERIKAVLAECGGVRVEAARRLGIERTTLYRLMKKLGIQSV